MRRPRIGLVTANIHVGVGSSLWPGVLAAAQRHDVDLLCLAGGRADGGETVRNGVYDLVDPDRLDGVVCWSSAVGVPGPGPLAARLTARLARLPVVTISAQVGAERPLTADGYRGTCIAIEHLIEVHGRRRLALLPGTAANPVMRERLRAYADTLARYRIPRDDVLVSAPVAFDPSAGGSAVRVLLDVRGLRPGQDFDAVVACSDVLAAGAVRALTGRGVHVPADVAVVGVNDSPEAVLVEPPLTSVALPFAELGGLAVDALLARRRGEIAHRVPSPPALVVRESCGCPGPSLPLPGEQPDPGLDRLDALLAELGRTEPGRGSDWAALVDALRGDDGAAAAFLAAVARSATEGDVDDRAATLVAAHRVALRHTTGPTRDRVDGLLARASAAVADGGRRRAERAARRTERAAVGMRELAAGTAAAIDVHGLRLSLRRHLPGLGVQRWELYPGSEVPDVAWSSDARASVVVEPLSAGGALLGLGLFEVGPVDGGVYRALGAHVGAALRRIRLVEHATAGRPARPGRVAVRPPAVDPQRSPAVPRAPGRDGAVRGPTDPVLVVLPDPADRDRCARLAAGIRPGLRVLAAADGAAVLAALGEDVPSAVVVATTLPDMDGFDLLDRLRGDGRLPDVPVLVIGERAVTNLDVRRCEPHLRSVLLGAGVLTDQETAQLLVRLGTGPAPSSRAGLLAKHAVAFLHQRYHQQITRRQLAVAAGTGEDYLSRVFQREIGVSPWEYLSRLRVLRAKERLREGDESIQVVARRVGFSDPAYFSRTFRRIAGMPPRAYRLLTASGTPASVHV